MFLDTLHSFVNIFAGGRSEIKAVLFVGFFSFLLVVYFLFQKRSFKPLRWRWFLFGILGIYVYGFLLHIFFIFSNNLSFTDFFITGNNGEISSSTIYHTHIAKGVIGQMFSFFGKAPLQTMDAGGAYIGFIPAPIFLFGSVLLSVVILQSVLYFTTSFKVFLSDKNVRQKIFLIFGYAVLIFSLIKTSIDGGFITPAFCAGFIFVGLFVLKTKNKLTINHYYIATLISIIILLLGLYVGTIKDGKGLYLAYISALSLLYIFILYASEKKIRLQFFVPLLILFFASWWIASARDFDIYLYSRTNLDKGQEVYVYDDKKNEVKILNILEEKSIGDLSKELGKNITYMPVSAPGVTCMMGAYTKGFSALLISDSPIPQELFSGSRYISIKYQSSNSFPNGVWHTQIYIFLNQCAPEPLSMIDGELKRNNIYKYIIVNPSFYDRAHLE